MPRCLYLLYLLPVEKEIWQESLHEQGVTVGIQSLSSGHGTHTEEPAYIAYEALKQ